MGKTLEPEARWHPRSVVGKKIRRTARGRRYRRTPTAWESPRAMKGGEKNLQSEVRRHVGIMMNCESFKRGRRYHWTGSPKAPGNHDVWGRRFYRIQSPKAPWIIMGHEWGRRFYQPWEDSRFRSPEIEAERTKKGRSNTNPKA